MTLGQHANPPEQLLQGGTDANSGCGADTPAQESSAGRPLTAPATQLCSDVGTVISCRTIVYAGQAPRRAAEWWCGEPRGDPHTNATEREWEITVAATQQAAPLKAHAGPADDWVRPYKAVLYVQGQGFDRFNEASLRHYAYRTDLLPKPKKVGRYAYYRLSDLDKMIAAM